MNSPVLGLADPCLGSDEPSGVSETRYFPQSIIYNWSCGHFSKQLLTAADDGEEMIARREWENCLGPHIEMPTFLWVRLTEGCLHQNAAFSLGFK